MAEQPSQATEALLNYISDGYNVPFGTFTWAQWQQMQAETVQRFTQFQRAIERKEIHDALLVALQMHEMSLQWLREVCSWMDEMK